VKGVVLPDASVSGRHSVSAALTALFVPGDRPERFSKAAATGADVVIIDLEDAVAAPAKKDALAAVLQALESPESGFRALVRINPLDSDEGHREVQTLFDVAGRSRHGLVGLVVPKAEDSQDLRGLAERCAEHDMALVALIETASGIASAQTIADMPGVTRLAFGAVDFSLDIDSGSEDRFLDYPRSVLVVASRAAGIAPPFDTPSIEIADTGAVEHAARLARGFGMGGKLCIHPAQVRVIEQAFTPTADEVKWAESIIGSGTGASQVDGQMIDRPVIERAQRILSRHRKDTR
jgi:citrate lyase subunit beta/citryl-CoA lyase